MLEELPMLRTIDPPPCEDDDPADEDDDRRTPTAEMLSPSILVVYLVRVLGMLHWL